MVKDSVYAASFIDGHAKKRVVPQNTGTARGRHWHKTAVRSDTGKVDDEKREFVNTLQDRSKGMVKNMCGCG
jgi:hypothetical protein